MAANPRAPAPSENKCPRTLLVLIALVSVAIGLLARLVKQARQQNLAVTEVCRCGGAVEYDWQPLIEVDARESTPPPPNSSPPGPVWVRRLLGMTTFSRLRVSS